VYVGGEKGTIVPYGLCTIADTAVPDGWHTTLAALVELTDTFLLLSLNQAAKQNYQLLVPMLAGLARASPPGYGNRGVDLLL
jgi:hypothetical protein